MSFTINKEDANNFAKIAKLLTPKQLSDFMKNITNCGDINVFEKAVPFCAEIELEEGITIDHVVGIMAPHVDFVYTDQYGKSSIISYSRKLTTRELDEFLAIKRNPDEFWEIKNYKHSFVPIRYYLKNKNRYVRGYEERIR